MFPSGEIRRLKGTTRGQFSENKRGSETEDCDDGMTKRAVWFTSGSANAKEIKQN